MWFEMPTISFTEVEFANTFIYQKQFTLGKSF
jgi:hypothetical protein